MLVVRKHFEDKLISARDVGGFDGEGGPAEWALAFAKKRANVSGDEAREVVGVFYAVFESKGADVVAVIEGDGAEFLQVEHALDVLGHRGEGVLAVVLRIFCTQFECGLE